ncbi:hypothetical protein M011DRAFT_411379 [Sporormia fimetaria CBS 119925]|uniref:FZ domain-containing protein n=1 Tax=Sporormia fimetaria CBS 119925 TaxID=1340428 RepID=A0A6A6UZ24_9PLEO|nr:hypothetical protein M011DRAFT_411379 [Sporormia fimetaria CBS 119925]
MRRPNTSPSWRLPPLLLALYIVIVINLLESPCLVHAAELPFDIDSTPIHPIHERAQVTPLAALEISTGEGLQETEGYVGDFAYFERELVGRAPEGVATLKDGEKMDMEAEPGTVSYFVLERSETGDNDEKDEANVSNEADPGHSVAENGSIDRRQEQEQTIYISVNTCRQPLPDVGFVSDLPPQLTLYVSTSPDNPKPGPDAKDDLAAQPVPLNNGSTVLNITASPTTSIYIGVEAPSLSPGWKGTFRFEVAVSTTSYYHSYRGDEPFLFMIDTDSESALFITHNITYDTSLARQWADLEPDKIPFQMYVFPENAWGAEGLRRSFCGIREAFNVNNSAIKVERSMTTRYGADLPKAQFHVQGLERNKNYTGFLLTDGTDKFPDASRAVQETLGISRGGRVWKQFQWKTKADDSCQVIYNLPFCNNIAYAVPSSPKFASNSSALAKLYDDQARSYYDNFSKSLAQIPCNTTATAQYSLARTCDDCARDYKTWLCSVLMPRCESISTPDPWLQVRNLGALAPEARIPGLNVSGEERRRWATRQSRNKLIDEEVKPGPYKELLPCEDLCFDIVRSCPAMLGFQCPAEGMRGSQYGKRAGEGEKGRLMCNFPGAVVDLNTVRGAGTRVGVGLGMIVMLMGVLVVVV